MVPGAGHGPGLVGVNQGVRPGADADLDPSGSRRRKLLGWDVAESPPRWGGR